MADRKPRQAPPPEADNPEVTLGANNPPSTIEGGETPELVVPPEVIAPDVELGALNENDRAFLWITHLDQGRKDNAAIEEAMNVVRGIRKRRNRNRNLTSSDGFILDEMDKILADETRETAELEKDAKTRRFMRKTAGMPTGEDQPDLFAAGADKESPNTLPESRAYADGYKAGVGGKDCVVPDYIAPEFHQGWVESWQKGQQFLFEAWERRQEIEKARQV